MDFDSLSVESLIESATSWGVEVLAGLAVFVIGMVAVRLARGTMVSVLLRAHLDPDLSRVIGNLLYYLLLSVVAIAVFGIVGIETASLITILGASSLAVGLALQGSLSNVASGVMLLVFRPFRVGDYIETGDFEGKVVEIGLFYMLLDTLDNVRVTLPNTYVAERPIENWSENGTRRLDLELEVEIGADLELARRTLVQALSDEERVLADPEPVVGVSEFGDSSARFVVRPWCRFEDYFGLRYQLPERLKQKLWEVDITMPTPQREVLLEERSRDG